MNLLESSGKPLFFRVENSDRIGFTHPPVLNGASLRTAVRSLSLMQKEALIASSATGAVWRVASDEGAYLNGQDAAPCPLAHLTTGMVASFMDEIQRLAANSDIDLRHIRLVQDNYYTMEGSALKGTMTGGALPVELEAEIDSPADVDALRQLVEEALRRSPAHGLVADILRNRFTLSHNGVQIDVGSVKPGEGGAEARPDFDIAQPSVRDWSALIKRNGMSPSTDEATSSAGSSFADQQSRRLHVRGICTLRPDGMKLIEQHLLNPHGSIFYFLSEEGEEAGGQGRAPDAMTYLSAGVAFCFMTQFGRYSRIVKKDIEEYSIVQDTHFSQIRDGGSKADPIETHVYILSDEDDAFPRRALDMSEQTCFLHALCRSESRVNARVVQVSAESG